MHRLRRGDHLLMLVMLALLQSSGAWGVSLFDRDEGWYACITRDMIATRDYVVPRYLGESAYFKPAWMYWCAAAAVHILGPTEFAMRLPGILASVAAWWIVSEWAGRAWGRGAAMWSTLIAGTMGLPHVAGTLFLADGHLLLWTVVAMRCLLDDTLSHCKWRSYVFWLAGGLGILAKGPAILVVLGAVTAARWLWDRVHWPGRGWYLAPLVASPWYVLVLMRDGPAFISDFVGKNAVDVATKATFGHGGPPGYHLALLPLTAWPWAALLPVALVAAWKLRRGDMFVRRLLLWAAAPWPIFELLGTKLPHYVLPLFPPIIMLIARELALLSQASQAATPTTPILPVKSRFHAWTRWLWRAALLFASIASAAAGAYFLWSSRVHSAHAAGACALVSVLLAGAVAAGWRARSGDIVYRRGALGLALASIAVGYGVLPRLEPFRLSRNVALCADDYARDGRLVATHGFDEPSMYYYLRSPALPLRRLANAPGASGQESIVLIARHKRLPELSADWVLDPRASTTLEGFNYVTGRWEKVWVGAAIRAAPP